MPSDGSTSHDHMDQES